MKKILLMICLLFVPFAHAGVDIASNVERVQIKNGALWIKMTDARFDTYCKPGWYGFNLFIPESDKLFPYYYGIVTAALTQGKTLFIANISIYDGSGGCDLTKTGYGVVMRN